ncbi:MAG: hypothetical protein IJS14_06905 [Lentisphaeria bacterium]|nr:hypothetical protein [Lentisphaeria bacterium]
MDQGPDFLTQEHTVAHHECGADAKLKLNCMLDYFQDIAACHADLLRIGMTDLQELHQLWVLSRLRLRFNRYPELGEKLTVMTYPTGLNRLFATRQYQLVSENGERAVEATSFWIVIDDTKFRPVKPFKMLADFDGRNQDKPRFFPELDKIAEPEGGVSENLLEYQVLQSNIDLNRHLNNAFYGSYIVDTLGRLAGRLCHPRELQINFLIPGALNARIQCGGRLDDGGAFYIDGRNAEGRQLCFQAEGRL